MVGLLSALAACGASTGLGNGTGGAAAAGGSAGSGGARATATGGAGGQGAGGSGGAVAAGSGGSGSAGQSGAGVGGSPGSGGASGAGGSAGASGMAGVSGSGGKSGTGGQSGAGGAAGATGTGGKSGAGGTTGVAGAGGAGGATGAGGEITLDPTPGNYQQTCDGSLGVMIDATHFLDGNDETQGMRLYTRGANAVPLETIDVSSAIGLDTSDEADLEDEARVGNRVYVMGSHGRSKDGKLERSRYRFFAMDVAGTSPKITLAVAGYTSMLLDQMLVAANWVTPNTAVIATLNAASQLGTTTVADLAPKVDGTNIEGLAWAPTTARPNQLLIGFRNPTQSSNAIIVSLLNADAVIGGATAQFGEATLLDLGGLGIRGMTWSPLHNAVLLIAGPQDASASPFRLFEWSGAAGDAPVAVQDLTNAPSDSAPEAIIVYPNTRDVQILFDQGDHVTGSDACKDADSSDQFFSDTIVHVP